MKTSREWLYFYITASMGDRNSKVLTDCVLSCFIHTQNLMRPLKCLLKSQSKQKLLRSVNGEND